MRRVALCPESVGLGKWSAGDKVDAKATVVVVVIVFLHAFVQALGSSGHLLVCFLA